MAFVAAGEPPISAHSLKNKYVTIYAHNEKTKKREHIPSLMEVWRDSTPEGERVVVFHMNGRHDRGFDSNWGDYRFIEEWG